MLQIVLAVLVLLALVTALMSTKNWHWSQVVLVIGVLLAGVGFLFLGAETLRIHRSLRAGLPKLKKQIQDYQQRNEALVHGTDDPHVIQSLFAEESPLDQSAKKLQGLLDLEHRLQIVTRERGRVWRGVLPAGKVDNQGRVEVEIPNPQPSGLQKDTDVFAFETGKPNAADPSQGAQYLGEFRVIEVKDGGAVLEPAFLIDQRSGQRLASSQGPWSLYQTMPTDRHQLFADLSEETLRKMLPAESVEEYLRQDTPATPDDDAWHRAGFDKNGNMVGPDDLDKAVAFRYERPLRDYAFLFAEFVRQRVVLLADLAAVTQDNAKLEAALQSAKQLSKFREKEKQWLASDLKGMRQDRQTIEAYRDLVQRQWRNARQIIDQLLASDSELASQLFDRQLGLLQEIDHRAPPPSGLTTLAP